MKIIHKTINIATESGINIYNVTPQIQEVITDSGIENGQVLVFSRHTTTALAINEYEERLLVDIKTYLEKLAPPEDKYLHNDLHLRVVPPDEPMNGHSHLMSITLSTSEIIPIVDRQLGLGKYQSVLFFELDGARNRNLFLQIMGL
jgi:secondary thiamine-phosphate synthase enzyme